ncbi:MAG: peptidylprolyl isomerase [Opitutaceae bacterium]
MRLLSIFTLALWGGISLGAATLKPVVTMEPADLDTVPDAPDTVIDLRTIFTIDGVDGPIVRYDTVVGQINVELFDVDAPLSVANFFKYVDQRSYDNSIIHRLEPDFVVQGGGYKVPSPITSLPAPITAFDPIVNEAGLPNLRGTLAMARTSELNSATSEWYFNLKDNPNLDNPLSPYAVFGRVIGSSILVVDAIGSIQPYTFGFEPFLSIPLIDPGSTPEEDDFVIVRSIRRIPLYPTENEPLSALTFTADSSNPSLVSASIEKANLRLAFGESGTGEATITLRGLDGDGNRATTSFLVTVRSLVPSITGQPLGRAVGIGGATAFTVEAESDAALSYQWRKNGQNISGATGSTLNLVNVKVSDAGVYEVLVSNERGSVTSSQAFLTVTADFGYLTNLSTRSVTSVEAGGTRTTPGFVTEGSGSIQILARAVGPGLAGFGVENFVPDPKIRLSPLNDRLNILAENSDWELNPDQEGLSAASTAAGAFALETGSKDGAVVAALASNAYTANILSEDGTVGVVLGEIYLVNDPVPGGSTLVNLSNRGQVGLGAEAMIGGFVVDGEGPVNLLIRGIGPSLTGFGVTGVLADPVIKVRDRDGQLIGSNDDWGDAGLGTALAAVSDSVGAFPLDEGSADAAILLVLDPGNYTVVLSGADDGTGTGLVEIYLVP